MSSVESTGIKTEKQDIAIVGISVACAGAAGRRAFWKNLANGVDSITEAPENIIDPFYFEKEPGAIDRFYCKRGGFVKGISVDPLRYGFLPISADGLDPDQLVSLMGIDEALTDAGIFQKKISLKNGCVIIGKGNFAGLVTLRALEIIRFAEEIADVLRIALPNASEADIQKVKKEYQQRQGRYQGDTAIGTMTNLVASFAANKFDMQGPAYTIDAACASGLLAVEHCMKLLRSGQCDVAVAGGLHCTQSATFWSAFNMMGAMSRKQQISPFSQDADGLLVGQGGGFIILKTLEKALKDDDRIYAIIKEAAICSDGGGSHVMVTSVQGQERTLRTVWEKAGMDPERVGYVEAHGTGTPIGDKTEIAALTRFFGGNASPRAYVGSLKSNIGHTMPAAGMLGLIKTALSLFNRQIPATLHCENPLPAMLESRFRPPQKLIPWDFEQIPPVAGVNSFGFGGVNAHAILVAYEETPEQRKRYRAARQEMLADDCIAVAASSAEELIAKLQQSTGSNLSDTSGDYRIVVFNNTYERVKKAIDIIQEGKPCIGRDDIWFTNKPLLSSGGKLVFMFSGFNLNERNDNDTTTVSDALDLLSVEDELQENMKDLSLVHFFDARLMVSAFKKQNISADIYIGHSLGEWNAATASGMFEEDFGRICLDFLGKQEIEKKSFEEYAYFSVNAKYESPEIDNIFKTIPELYLIADNCPGQIIVCAIGEETKEKFLDALKKEKIYAQKLEYGSSAHTPYYPYVEELRESLKKLQVQATHVSLWSALDFSPVTKDSFVEQLSLNLREPVYFRKLIEKLYHEENARIFVQMGDGSLDKFVEDNLKNREYAVMPTLTSQRPAIDQMRRIHALLYIEGSKAADLAFMGMPACIREAKNLLKLPVGAPVNDVSSFSSLREAVAKNNEKSGMTANLDFLHDSVADKHASPLLNVLNDNLRDAALVQKEMIDLFLKKNGENHIAVRKSPAPVKPALSKTPQKPSNSKKTGTTFSETIKIDLESYPYLLDHAIVRQPKGWKHPKDLHPVAPLTFSIETFAEIAQKQAPQRKILKISNLFAIRFIQADKPFEGVVKGKWKDENTLELTLAGYLKLEVTFGDQYPVPSEIWKKEIDLGKESRPPMPGEEAYERYSFHDPLYRSIKDITYISEGGLRIDAERGEAKGSLLDSLGQAVGIYMHLTEQENRATFPVRLSELNFYSDISDQDGKFKLIMIVTDLTKNYIVADAILSREGKIWAVIKSWVNQRFELGIDLWNVFVKPQSTILASSLGAGAYYYFNTYAKSYSIDFLYKRYLSHIEKDKYDSLDDKEQKQAYLSGRVALKDAIRTYSRNGDAPYCFPVEIHAESDEGDLGSMRLKNLGNENLDGIFASLAQTEEHSVAVASNKPVGIEILSVEELNIPAHEGELTQKERSCLPKDDRLEWVARFLAAKAACRKVLGKEAKLEITHVSGEEIMLGDVCAKTAKLGTNHVLGWTI